MVRRAPPQLTRAVRAESRAPVHISNYRRAADCQCLPPSRQGERISFWDAPLAAYVSGVAALAWPIPRVDCSPLISRIVQSAQPACGRGTTNWGNGLVVPVAALTFNIPSGDRCGPKYRAAITPAAPPSASDHRAQYRALRPFASGYRCAGTATGLATEARVDVRFDRVQPAQCEAGRRGVDSACAVPASWALGGQPGAPWSAGRVAFATPVGSAGVVVGGTGASNGVPSNGMTPITHNNRSVASVRKHLRAVVAVQLRPSYGLRPLSGIAVLLRLTSLSFAPLSCATRWTWNRFNQRRHLRVSEPAPSAITRG